MKDQHDKKSIEQEQIRDNIRSLECFHCGSRDVYWHYRGQRFECVDCGSFIEIKPNKNYSVSVVKSDYVKGCVKILGMIRIDEEAPML